MIEFMWGKGGSGIEEWQPKSEYFHGFVNKSRDVIDKVTLGKVKPRRAVVKVSVVGGGWVGGGCRCCLHLAS